ncbi:MAG TPA: chemotaxis protein CheC, partial [Myxococcaceae bacterium]|nr:chemotaxis protein CheC [Myxococcaceae bacterium]
MIFLSPPNEAQLDALREVTNVGCGHAANALSKLVGGRKVQIEVPRVVLTRAAEMPQIVGGVDAPVVIIALDMLGELQGRLLLVLQEGDAQQLSAQLLNDATRQQVELSAICEAGNIVASACLNAIGSFTGLRL